ncbi:hypothetical protein M5C72_02645 [Companilactobacillus allii]|uniref:Uncharacterized protein n=1 Tax=Companilactobacillus allii TaxID=1847728 RepID=A0A1P8Q2J9_9LACO|nr:hypothetical protein [Companilactobacillus allii]APX72061.1 hypothetical protein BTM29_05565 [Companilactobacillus allii]USQ69153.1 hypothetical protein M5C72_02645 [Companilactobacillus allii]
MKYKLKLDYTEDELNELKELRKDYKSPINAIHQIIIVTSCDDPFRNLRAKYFAIGHEDEFDFMADINNVVMGTAIFPNKLYIVHDTNTNSVIYHDDINNKLIWAPLCFYRPVKRTKEEWLEINPAYEPMLEMVED